MSGRRGLDIQELAIRLGYKTVERRPNEARWWAVVAAAVVVTAACLGFPALRLPAAVVWAFGAVGVIALRAVWSSPPSRNVWWLFAAGGALFVVGLATRSALSSPSDPFPLPSAADFFMAPGFVVLALAGYAAARLRRGGEPRPGDRFDAAIVAGTAALVVWSLVVAPVVSDGSLPLSERALEALYTVLGLGLIFFVVEGGLGPGYSSASYRLLMAFAVFLWVIDAFGAEDVASLDVGDALFLAVPIPASLAAAAAVEPSARWAFGGPDPDSGDRQALRLVIAGFGLVVGPGLQVLLLAMRDVPGEGVAVVGGTLLTLLIFVRLVDLIATGQRGEDQRASELRRLRDANLLLRRVDVMSRDATAPADVAATAVDVGGRATSLLGAEVVALVVADNAQGIWVPRLAQGVALATATDPDQLPSPLDLVARSQDRVLVLGRAPRFDDPPPRPLVEGMGSGVYAPLRGREGVVGVFAVEHPDPDRWTLADHQLVAELAEVLAVTADNARSVRRLRTRQAIENRQDVARDLHDQFGQVLTTLGLEVDRLIGAGGADDADLEKLRDAMSRASVEVRSALRSLRPLGGDGESFERAARSLLERLGGVGPKVTLVISEPSGRAAPEVEAQMLGILQEALTNARRHGQATKVEVMWTVDVDNTTHLVVADDGVGFVLATAPGGTLGLVGMAERAELIDARLRVDSAPGAGCRITVDAPPWQAV
jgi:signal transduction histidine kinase